MSWGWRPGVVPGSVVPGWVVPGLARARPGLLQLPGLPAGPGLGIPSRAFFPFVYLVMPSRPADWLFLLLPLSNITRFPTRPTCVSTS